MSRKLTIEDMHAVAAEHGGRCLSEVYVDAHTPLLWQCGEGHKPWLAKPCTVRNQRSWCLKCSRTHSGEAQRLSIEDMQALAAEHGGKCLSPEYVNNHTKLLWQCREGHKPWRAVSNNVQQGAWCPICAKCASGTLEEMIEMAAKYGGKCLSTIYVNAFTKLRWRCGEGHEWLARPYSIKHGHWCPFCSTYLGERICRGIFEVLFGEKFPKQRPDWLKSPRGSQMELDGYCESLKLAFEYNGIQHYEEIPHFHRHSRRSFRQQKEDDAHKAARCSEKGIVLLIIPFADDYDGIEGRVRGTAKKQGVLVPVKGPVDWKSLQGIYDLGRLREMQELAAKRGGKCLSKTYISVHTKLLWRCADGHAPWLAEPNTIQGGHWCPTCAGLTPGTMEKMLAFATKRGGKCLSTIYVNAFTKLRWQCSEGHEPWLAKPNDIQAGHWCPTCARKKIAELQKERSAAREAT